jgi:hypothetical protein
LYALFRKDRLHQVEAALDAFHTALDERIPLISPIQMLAETNDLLRAQTAALKALGDALARDRVASPGLQA